MLGLICFCVTFVGFCTILRAVVLYLFRTPK